VCIAGLVSLAGGAVVMAVGHPRRQHALSDAKVSSSATSTTIAAAAHQVVPGDGNLFSDPAVASYLAGATDDVTAAVYDEVTGITSLYRPGVVEQTASIIKVDILATLLAQDQADGHALTPADQGLSQNMIEESDNDAAQSLWDAEGGAAAVQRFNTTAGLTQTAPDTAGYWGLSTTTAEDQVQLVRTIAYPNDVLTPGSQGYELGLMSSVDPSQDWGVSAGVAPGTTVALKNGWLPNESGIWQVNSIGYVNGDGRDYVIAVLTDGSSNEAAGIDTIEDLSTLIWQALAPATT
jgi:beta-lactamase class A